MRCFYLRKTWYIFNARTDPGTFELKGDLAWPINSNFATFFLILQMCVHSCDGIVKSSKRYRLNLPYTAV